jgi:hypothetical protein
VAALGGTPARTVDPAHVTYAWFPDLTRADLGIGATTAYWLTDLGARATGPGAIARIDATSGGIAEPAVTAQHDSALFAQPLAQTEYALTWTPGARPAARDALHVSATGVGAATVQLSRAHLACPTITATSDGPMTLTLAGLARGSTVLRGTTVVATADAGRTARIALGGGTTTVQVHCAHAAGASRPRPSPHVARPAGALAATGLRDLPWAATLLVVSGAAMAVRRRRRI